MPSSDQTRQALERLFQRQQTAQLEDLFSVLKTRSRMTVFRRLSSVGYLSSYNQAGRYYTLASVPAFDDDGLWQHAGACFSREGTLKDTVARLVETASAGLLHRELQLRLQVRVYNTLADLLHDRRIGREHLESEYLYVNADRKRAAIQVAHRHRQSDELAKKSEVMKAAMDPLLVIEVLIEVIHSSVVHLDTQQVVARLTVRGIAVTAAQVEEIFRHHGVGKKTVRSRSRRSRR
jgi:hypothetical protein